MISVSAAVGFSVAVGAMVITPGPGFAVFLSTIISHGRQAAASVVTGMLAGIVIIGTLILLLYPLLAPKGELLQSVLRVLGGTYLLYLGLGTIRAGATVAAVAGTRAVAAPAPRGGAFVSGVVTNMTNPGIFVIYLLIVPAFLSLNEPWRANALVLVALHLLITAAWYALLIVAAGFASRQFADARRVRAIRSACGGLLLAMGLKTLLGA